MTANLGLEAVPATPAGQNITLSPFVNPPTELFDGTNLPQNQIGVEVTPIASATDGTQIWKITHNGVDTHPIHWHLYDLQLLNRVTWDNIIIPPDATELGWKDTLRISPLEDTYVAIRPILPDLPFELPNSVRPLHPMTPFGSEIGFNNVDQNGNPTDPVFNQLVNFGWEYVWHCHILSHEEMDMMRPQVVAMPPNVPDRLTYHLNGNGRHMILRWHDNSINETAFVVQRNDGNGWIDAGTVDSPLISPNVHEFRRFRDPVRYNPGIAYQYRVLALNTVGYGGAFMSLTAQSVSETVTTDVTLPLAPTNLRASLQAGPQVRLVWADNATNETGFTVQRSTNGGGFVTIATVAPRNNTGNKAYVDTTVVEGDSYSYQVAATNDAGSSAFSNSVDMTIPGTPSILSATVTLLPNNIRENVTLTWADVVGETGYRIQWSTDNFATVTGANTIGADSTTFTSPNLLRQAWQFRVGAMNASGRLWSPVFNVAAP